jgi:hypothetical protein
MVTAADFVAPTESVSNRVNVPSVVPAVNVVVGPVVVLSVPAVAGKLQVYGGRPPVAWKIWVCPGLSVAAGGVIVRSV